MPRSLAISSTFKFGVSVTLLDVGSKFCDKFLIEFIRIVDRCSFDRQLARIMFTKYGAVLKQRFYGFLDKFQIEWFCDIRINPV